MVAVTSLLTCPALNSVGPSLGPSLLTGGKWVPKEGRRQESKQEIKGWRWESGEGGGKGEECANVATDNTLCVCVKGAGYPWERAPPSAGTTGPLGSEKSPGSEVSCPQLLCG
jgi:hypothetical protein